MCAPDATCTAARCFTRGGGGLTSILSSVMGCGGIWKARIVRHWMDDPEDGRVCLPFSPLRFGDAPAPALKPTPFFDQHKEEVLGGIFGFSVDERAALREVGAISVAGLVKRSGDSY